MSETLLLIGMQDSPFVRHVADTLELAHIPYRSIPLSVGDSERFAAYSPLKRAPTLVLEDGETVFDSHLILSYLGERFPEVASQLPADSTRRLRCYQVMGAATGLADKAVSAVYEKLFHDPECQSPALRSRLHGQLVDTLGWLEHRAPEAGWLHGEALSQADIAVATAVRFAQEAHADIVSLDGLPRLTAWCARAEELPELQKTYEPFHPPRPSIACG